MRRFLAVTLLVACSGSPRPAGDAGAAIDGSNCSDASIYYRDCTSDPALCSPPYQCVVHPRPGDAGAPATCLIPCEVHGDCNAAGPCLLCECGAFNYPAGVVE